MTAIENWINRFVTHLESYREQEDRGALAMLRRGMGNPPGSMPEIYQYILPWAPNDRWTEDACYIVGSLFASHPLPKGTGSVGKAFSMIRDPSESTEKRFTALLNSHRDDLPVHLRHAVSLLKSKDIPVDWRQLLHDICYWDHESRFVQQQWARDFWQHSAPEIKTEEEKIEA